MKRTLMLKNKELLDFEVDTAEQKILILDAPDPNDESLSALGLGGPDMEFVVARAIRSRRISGSRDDIAQILDAFGVRSTFDLAFMGHGLSLIDKLWYRAPGATERWEDVNFYDNDWDSTYRTSVLSRDYKSLASCSPDIPDLTTPGHLRKAWERTDDGIQLIKEPLFESGHDLDGALLGAELCRVLYGQNAYQPLCAVERFGRRFEASPLMIGADEELIQGYRLFAMGGFSVSESVELMNSASTQRYIDILSRAGVADASAHTAKAFAFKDLALLADMHEGNFGVIRGIETGACRAAPPFDYDRSFGFPFKGFPFESLCNKPDLAAFLCACHFSDLDSSWDWSWYDPQALEGFEERIAEAHGHSAEFPSNLGELVARLFVMQRNYVDEVALKWQENHR